ncbi:MAG: DUF4231 domain-containing protein [Planctomycetota bacterium]
MNDVDAPPLKGHKDIKSDALPALSWNDGQRAASVRELGDYCYALARSSRDWYFDRRLKTKKYGGRALRVGALIAAAGAGVLPILAEIYSEGDTTPIAPGWSAVLLALAALLVALDKFWGFTSAWVRYVRAGQDIDSLMTGFVYQIERLRLSWKAEEPTAEEADVAIAACAELTRSTQRVIEKETDQWAAEFQSALVMIERQSAGSSTPEGKPRG